jgi:hypothetical protein
MKYKQKNTSTDWNFVKDGTLPDTNRTVQVLYRSNMIFSDAKINCYLSNFNPSNGWSYTSGVIAWREIDEETQKIIDQHEKTTYKGNVDDE